MQSAILIALLQVCSYALYGLHVTKAFAQTSLQPAHDNNDCRTVKPGKGLCIPLGRKNTLVLTAEYRVRAEHQDRIDYGLNGAPVSSSIAHRFVLGTDVAFGDDIHVVAQVAYADQSGRRPRPRPFDESAPDLAQAYLVLPIKLAEAQFTLRAGRQELTLANRLLGLRDGVTLRRAFDGIRGDLVFGDAALTGFALRPVRNRPGAFDDDRVPGEHFSGLNLALVRTGRPTQYSIYVFHRTRPLAQFVGGTGEDDRTTFGTRISFTDARWDVTAQTAIQVGRTGDRRVRAGAAFIDAGWSHGGTIKQRIGIQLGAASGDPDPTDGTASTFDPIYPNLSAYTDLPLLYSSNQLLAQINATTRIDTLSLKFDATLFGRATAADGIYASPGRLIALPRGASRFSGYSLEATARWAITPRLEAYGSLLRAQVDGGLQAAGGQDINFMLLQVTAKL